MTNSARHFRPPCAKWISPIYPLQHVAELSGRDGDHAIRWRGPNEPAAFQALRVERHAKPIMPKDLQQVATFATENVKIAGVRIAAKSLLNLQRQPIHAAPHIGHTGGQPDTNPRRWRNHPRSAVSTRRKVARLTFCPVRTMVPSSNTMSI